MLFLAQIERYLTASVTPRLIEAMTYAPAQPAASLSRYSVGTGATPADALRSLERAFGTRLVLPHEGRGGGGRVQLRAARGMRLDHLPSPRE